MKKKDKRFFRDKFAPTIVLFAICMVVTVALSSTYGITSPVIAANQKAAEDAARLEVFPAGDSFTEYDGKLEEGVQNCFVAGNEEGIAVTSEYKGFGGAVTVMTGIDADGKITGVKVTDHSETPGLGTKAADPEYLKQYLNISELKGGHINNDTNIDAVTGATITSNAVYCSVDEALAQFRECRGGNDE